MDAETFGAAAARLAGFCCLRFGWSPDQFWRATPAEVGVVVRALTPAAPGPVTTDELSRLERAHG